MNIQEKADIYSADIINSHQNNLYEKQVKVKYVILLSGLMVNVFPLAAGVSLPMLEV